MGESLPKHKKQFPEVPDSELWSRFKKGDTNSYEQIVHSHYDFLYNYGLSLHHDGQIIKDCIQELFIKIWISREQLNDVSSIKYYLLKSFRRLVINSIVQERKVKSNIQTHINENLVDFETSQEEKMISVSIDEENIKKLAEAIDDLTQRHREAIHLRYYQDMDYQQIVEIMGISYQSVRNTISQAIKALKKNYKKK